jgi:tetratricopeptide (TPR) repeat protein
MKNLHLPFIILFSSLIALLLSCATPSQTSQSGYFLRSTVVYTPTKQVEKLSQSQVKSGLEELLKKAEIKDLKNGNLNISTTDISVTEDRIEIRGKEKTTVVNFVDLLNTPINVERQYFPNAHVKANSSGTYVLWARVNGKLTEIIYKPFQIAFKDICYNFGDNNLDDARKLADYLYFFQKLTAKKQINLQLAQFETTATQYRALKVKPPVSEEQRKYIVQANAFNQEKNYTKAIELYKKAIEMDATAYPAAYMNLALLSAQVSKFDEAIFSMKKYLLLDPDSKDSRSAQDKIYEWEIKLEQ